jgi:hypothetical protein
VGLLFVNTNPGFSTNSIWRVRLFQLLDVASGIPQHLRVASRPWHHRKRRCRSAQELTPEDRATPGALSIDASERCLGEVDNVAIVLRQPCARRITGGRRLLPGVGPRDRAGCRAWAAGPEGISPRN